MKRIIYNSQTGKIVSCRNIPDHMLDKNLAKAPNLAYINGEVANTTDFKINLDTTTVEAVDNTTPLADWLRLRRNIKLTACDWTQGADSPLSDSKKAEWQTYRQALRDLPSTTSATVYRDIVWPTKPS